MQAQLLTICRLTLHSWLVIERNLNGLAFSDAALSGFTLDKTVNPAKKAFLINQYIFISYYSFSLNTYECLKNHEL